MCMILLLSEFFFVSSNLDFLRCPIHDAAMKVLEKISKIFP